MTIPTLDLPELSHIPQSGITTEIGDFALVPVNGRLVVGEVIDIECVSISPPVTQCTVAWGDMAVVVSSGSVLMACRKDLTADARELIGKSYPNFEEALRQTLRYWMKDTLP